MKPKDLRPLLDEVLPEAGAKGGPSCPEVLGMVREERAKRGQRRVMGAMLVMVLGLTVWRQGQGVRSVPEQRAEVVVPVAVPVVKKEKPVLAEVKRINDDELLELLGDVPSALLEWPNGEKTLLIVEHQRGEF
ncbi:MAG: hypothetical protein ACO1QS_19280 [Verrucomicrobiota bacterium]